MSADLRVSDQEREDAARLLGEHFAAGRLDHGEYDERSSLAFAARTRRDLAALFRDLPEQRATHPSRHRPGSARPPARRGPGTERPPIAAVVALLAVVALIVAVVTGAIWVFFVVAGVALCKAAKHHHPGRLQRVR